MLLAASALAGACSQKIETKAPDIAQPSASAMPPPVDPEIVCNDQSPSKVTLHGEHFIGTPIGLPDHPKVALPTVSLLRSHELDGADVKDPDAVVYSGDYADDPTNAVDKNGELIRVGGETLLTWTSQQKMSFLVTQNLVLGEKPEGDDHRKRGLLEAGVWDVAVTNASGKSADSLGALAVVNKPELTKMTPGIVCLDQGPRTIKLEGQTLLRNGADKVQLSITGAQDPFALKLSDCTKIDHPGLDAEVCTTATTELAKNSVPAGYPAVKLENPKTAACTSEEEVSLRVVSAPHISGVVESLACIAQGGRSFTVQGTNFLRVDGKTAPAVSVGSAKVMVTDMKCDAPLDAGEHKVELCSGITFQLMPGDLDPGVYDVSVVNPDNPDGAGCSSIAMDALRITAPPSIDAVEPGYVCLQDGAREVTLQGSGFLVVGGEKPAVELDGTMLADAAVDAAGCDMATNIDGVSVRSCARLVLTVKDGDVDLGNPTVHVTNPAPAGCDVSAMDLWTVLARPTLTSATPLLVCTAQGNDMITLTGKGFLALGSKAPTVTAGGVAAASVKVTSSTCKPISGRDDGKLCTELVASFTAGSLPAGVQDVVVTNTDPAGCVTQDAIALVAVDPPQIAMVAPNPICLEQAVNVTITGSNFVHIGSMQPSVALNGMAVSSAAVTDATCQKITGTKDAFACTEIVATIPMSGFATDTYRVSVTNPGTLDCTSMEMADLKIVPPPTITSIDNANVCTGGGTISVTGTGLSGATARLVDPNTQGVINALNTVADGDGTHATITFSSGVQPSTYKLVIAGPSGCGDTASQDVVAAAGPVVFFLDPPVTYNGVALRATIYASGVTTAPAGVILTPQGGGTVADQKPLTNVAWPAGNAHKIGATIPSGVDEGTYDVTVDWATGCDAVLGAGVKIEADTKIALLTPALTPQFGKENTEIAVNVSAKATGDLKGDEVNFKPTPRAYLSSSSLSFAEPLRAVAFDNEARLTAIVPNTLAAGVYDLVVVNPDGAVGFQAGAYKATTVAPPVIDDVVPTQLDNDMDRPITITGTNFENPSTAIEVTLLCETPGSDTPNTIGPLQIAGGATTTTLIATVPDGISHGSVCVVRVTNTDNDTFDEFSALTVTNPASKLPAFQEGTELVEGRRAPAAALGAATREARFVYAIGGDDGDSANALTSVEAAPIGRFGDLGEWRTLATALPQGVTLAKAQGGGRYVYLFGGLSADAATKAIRRAVVLDPNAAPKVNNVDMRFFATPDSDPATRDGLAPGAWTYVVSAVYSASDTDNPSGESLRSEPITVYAPDVPDGVEVELDWDAVLGADNATEATKYRIYRTTAPNSAVTALRLLAEVNSPTHTFVDQNPATFQNANKLPLAIGDLGEWRTLAAELNTPRAAYGISLANDTNCDPHLYLVGGSTDAATQSATYEYATFDSATGALGAFTQATGNALTARRELAVFVADDQTSTQFTPAVGCEAYLYASYGQTGASTFVTSVEEAAVTAGGALGAFTGSGPAPQNFTGHAAFFSSDGAYVMGGASNSADAIKTAVQAAMCSGSGCTAPNLKNFSSASNSLRVARYLPGFARQGAFFYLIGGADADGAPLSSSESNVR